ncbi:hypothetical protein RhiirA5_480323 [Rhizophagus irregularis]|uniref:Uncharacterized protein n=1 Tax=Rhizophagus irregularis TaxID=588596 RepID=A0A2I1EQ11_9GLOM|nr:hypothetical protein RhiirA5_480323 [Rhizophagus irregularis]PKY24218.1 hypothetical protein RhiirB3_507878 [Rhizophagus irregularis]
MKIFIWIQMKSHNRRKNQKCILFKEDSNTCIFCKKNGHWVNKCLDIPPEFQNKCFKKKISFTADVYDPKVDVTAIHEVVDLNGDELLRIISNVSSRNIRKIFIWIQMEFHNNRRKIYAFHLGGLKIIQIKTIN